MDNFSCCFKRKKDKELVNFYDKGTEKLENALDIEKILKDIQYVKTFLKCKFINTHEEFLLEHNKSNVINLDSDLSNNSDIGISDKPLDKRQQQTVLRLLNYK